MANRAKGATNTTCPVCGKMFHVKPSRLKRSKNVCCSYECNRTLRSILMKGQGNHMYGIRGASNKLFKGNLQKRVNHLNIDFKVYRPKHPFADTYGFVLQHRLIVQENAHMFNRNCFIDMQGVLYLKKDLVVHHKDGNHSNNDINNLQILSRGEHTTMHNKSRISKRCSKTGKFIKSDSVKFKLLSTNAKKPVRTSDEAAGYDMYAADIVETEDTIVYKTDVAIELPEGYAGFLMPRSSVVKTGMHLGNSVGLLDSDFRGNISFVFYKRQNCTPYAIGDRVGQLVVIKLPNVVLEESEDLSETERGINGFGSSGR